MSNQNNFITLTCVDSNGNPCSNLFLGTDANNNNHTINVSLDVDKLVEEKGVGIAEMQGATLTLRGDVVGQLQSCTAQYSTGEQSVVEYVAENGEVSLPIDLRPLLFAETPTLTLINANQQGGLQITDTQIHIENSDNIATVFSENIGEMYSINEETGEYSESLVCSNKNRIYLHANISNPFGEYTVLKFKLSKPTSGRFPVYLATPADEDVATGYYLVTGIPIGYLGYYSVGNECFAEIDITNLVEENVCLCIKPEVGSAHFTGEMFCEKISHSESDFQDNGSHIQKSFGAKANYDVNVANGRMFYLQQIFESQGNLMPANIYAVYNSHYVKHNSIFGNKLVAKGWKLNYQQFINFSNDICVYVDEAFKEHIFKRSENNADIYFDSSAKTGLTLYKKNNDWEISDGINSTLLFTNKRLTKITTTKGNNPIITEIVYNNDGSLSQIKDGMGKIYTFEENAQSQVLKNSAGQVLVQFLCEEDDLLSQITYSDQQACRFSYGEDYLLSGVEDFSTNEKMVFEYSKEKVSAIKIYGVKDQEEIPMESVFLEYFDSTTYISSCVATGKKEPYYKCQKTFDSKGSILNSCEIDIHTNNPIGNYTYYLMDNYMQGSFISNQETKVASFFSNDDSSVSLLPSINKEQIEGAFVDPVNDQVGIKKDYAWCVSWDVSYESDDDIARDDNVLEVEIICGDFFSKTYMYEAKDFSWRREVCFIPYIIDAISPNPIFRARSYNNAGVLKFKNVVLEKVQTTGLNYTLTGDSTGIYTIQQSGTSEKTWGFPIINSITVNNSLTIAPVEFTYYDYLQTTINRLKNPENFNVFYNNGKNMYANVTSLDISIRGSKKSIESLQLSNTVTGKDNATFNCLDFNTSEFLKITTVVNRYITDEDIEYCESYQEYNEHLQTVKTCAIDGVITTYSYDDYGNLIRQQVVGTEDNANIIQTMVMSEDGRYLNKQQFYINDKIYQTEYFYNERGNIYKIIPPNQQEIKYVYQGGDKLSTVYSSINGVENKNNIYYDGNFVSQFSHNGTNINLEYNKFNECSHVAIGDCFNINKSTQRSTDGRKYVSQLLQDGAEKRQYYDKWGRFVLGTEVVDGVEFNRVINIFDDEPLSDTKSYYLPSNNANANAKLRKHIDNCTGRIYNYSYNEKNQVDKISGEETTTFSYDEQGRLTQKTTKINGASLGKSYTYKNVFQNTLVGEMALVDIINGMVTWYERDSLGRLSTIAKKQVLEETGYLQKYTYTPRIENDVVVGTTPFISKVTTEIIENNVVKSSKYENICYDANGNITQYGTTTYEYDRLNRLVREDNHALNKTFTWAYDAGGNITSKKEYAYTTGELGNVIVEKPYTYGSTWKDQLVSFNGSAITYDQAGNPLSYKGNTFEWQRGKLLTKATLANGTVVNMTYYANGLRASKQVGNATHKYYYDSDGNIIQIATHYVSGSTVVINFTYDGTGVTGFVADGNYYYFVKNLFGDVTDLYCGTVHVAHYTYDAWGNHTVTDQYGATISDQYAWANVNPFRYRGYYYDVDLGLYYLQSRYYDPQTGRFINADTLDYLDPETINGLNLYAYCVNDPVNRFDPSGHAWEWSSFWQGVGYLVTGIGAIVAGALVIASGVATWPMLLVAGITIGAGALTIINGASEVVEAGTGYNFVEDTVFGGNSSAYNTYATITGSVATIGSIVCGGWYRYNTPRIKAYKALDAYNVKSKHLSGSSGNWNKFSSSDQVYLRSLGKTAIKNTPMSKLLYNSSDSYRLLYDFGSIIGTGG